MAPPTVADARAAVLAEAAPLPAEAVAVGDALGRVLAEDVTAAGDHPPFDTSAMDGFAVAPGPAGRTLRVVGESRAGAPAERAPGEGEALAVSTGAALPPGTEAVIRVEDTERAGGGEATGPTADAAAGANLRRAGEAGGPTADASVGRAGETIRTTADTPAGANVRRAGEDVRAGATVLTTSTRLGPAELGAAVVAGRAELACARRPRVALLTTGDELVPPGGPLGPGQIHDSNTTTLRALTIAAGAEVVHTGRAGDTLAATQDALADALDHADVVLVSGGVSVGPHDHVKPALHQLGVTERFWRVALRPGGPTWFGTRDRRLVFGLPGNPVSAYVTFVLFARPALLALQGADPKAAALRARTTQPLPRLEAREQAVRVRLRTSDTGWEATPTGPQGSHVLTSLVNADGLATVPAGDGDVPAGASVDVELL